MFKDTFVLKKTAWHMRLMTYIWGLKHYHFSHLCPYFWLSIVNVIISPVFLPLKFFIVTLFVRWFLIRGLWRFFVWSMQGFERVCKGWADDYGDWCARQQDRWWEEREQEIAQAKERAIRNLERIPPKVLERIQDTIKYDGEYRTSESIIDRCFKIEEERKPKRRWRKWLIKFVDLHKEKPQIVQTLIDKANEFAAKQKEIQEEKKSFQQAAFTKMESDEDKQLRLQREVSIQEQKELRAHAKKLQEEEDMRKAVLRAEHRRDLIKKGKQRVNRILKWAQPIAKGFIYLVGGCVALIGLFFLVKGIRILVKAFGNVDHSTYVDIGDWLKWILIGAVAIGIIILIVMGLAKLFKNISFPSIVLPKIKIGFRPVPFPIPNLKKFNKPANKIGRMFSFIWRKIICKGCYYIAWPFIKAVKAIGSFFKLFKQTIKDECPAVKWED